MKRIFQGTILALSILMFAASAQAQMVIDSLTGPVTQNEINSFKNFMRGQTPADNNFGLALAHHTPGMNIEALGIMYEVSHDQQILDIMVNFSDHALHGRNNPTTGLILWDGVRELSWPIGVQSDGIHASGSTQAENGTVIAHIAYAALLILQNPAIWNNTVTIGDNFGFGATYKQRALTYVRELDQTQDTYMLKWFVNSSNNYESPNDPRYPGAIAQPFPWNQQQMMNGALIRLSACHSILGDDPTRVARYDLIVKTNITTFANFLHAHQHTVGGNTVYVWPYGGNDPSITHVEDTGHASFDVWGMYYAFKGGKYGADLATQQGLINTLLDVIWKGGTSFSGKVDGSGTIGGIGVQWLFYSGISTKLYNVVAPALRSQASGSAYAFAGIMQAKNTLFNGGNFSLSATPGSQTIPPGGSTSYTVNVSSTGGFNGAVGLSVSGLPSGATGTLNPTSVNGGSGPSTLSVSTSSSTPDGTYTLTVTGTSGSLTNTTSTTLVVHTPPAKDFSLSASPSTQTVIAGASANYAVTVSALNGFTGAVSLSAASSPAGVTLNLNPASVTGSGSSTLSASTATPGTYTITITGSSGSLSHSAMVNLTVNPVTNNCSPPTPANGTWVNTAFPSHNGTFTATFDVTPSISGQSSAVGLSHGAQTSFAGFANLVAFATTGVIQARNGGSYINSAVHYSGGTSYHFRLAINVTMHTYSIFVTPAGGAEQNVGTNFAFRTEQNTVTSLDHWGSLVNATSSGTLTVCNFTAQ
ncbi:MAG TPA: hypothetical protein VFA71_09660 [Terriglobales bacterium]|nr:hypothetical protein [Terriglobales bacterium]